MYRDQPMDLGLSPKYCLADLESDPEKRSLLPEGFHDIWAPIWEARKRIKRETRTAAARRAPRQRRGGRFTCGGGASERDGWRGRDAPRPSSAPSRADSRDASERSEPETEASC